MRGFFGLVAIAVFISSCALPLSTEVEDRVASEIVLHGAGGGHWLPNSRNAVLNSLADFKRGNFPNPIHAFEVDVVLTKDQQLVLSHDPWVNKELCLTAAGDHPGHILIRDLTLREVQQEFICGHRSLSEFPYAQIKSEPMMSLSEMLDAVSDSPQLAIYLDVKIQEGSTADEVSYARALDESLRRHALSNKIYLEGPTVAALAAYRNYINFPYQSILSYPPFYAGENWTLVGALALVKTYFNADFPIDQAREVAADFVSSPIQVLSETAVEGLQDQNIGVILYTANDARSFEKACALRPDFIITDYPELAGSMQNCARLGR